MSEKTFPPSVERLNKARRNGEVAVSKLFTLALGLSAAGATIWWGPAIESVRSIPFQLTHSGSVVEHLQTALWAAFRGITFPIIAMVSVTVSIGIFQTRGLIFFGALKPKPQHFGPLGWWKKGCQGVMDAVLGVARIIFLLLVLLPVWLHGAVAVQEILRLSLGYGVSWNGVRFLSHHLLVGSLVRCSVVLLLLGMVSYGFVRWRFMKKMMMSLHEVKEESREQEGDPHVKSARRHEHEALLMSDLVARVKRAKVIVVDRRPA